MDIDLVKISAVFATIGGVWLKIKNIYENLAPLLDGFIKDAEQRAKDGLIDKKDRKELAMFFITQAQAQGKLRKFGFIEKMVVSKVVDVLAEKLPDFKFTK